MKTLIIALLALVGFGQAQIVTVDGRTQRGDSLRWGDADDSAGYILARGNSIYRDSSGTWKAITTDSCSLPVKLTNGATMPNSKLELTYQVRTSSGNTDSSQIKLAVDSRYCKGVGLTLACEDWVPAGRFRPDAMSEIADTLSTFATTSGTTWKPTRHIFDVPGGTQIRFCADGYKAGSTGGGSPDSTFFRRFVVRTSSIPSGGTPPSSATLTGDITVSDVTVTSSALPSGAATAAKQPALGTAGTASTDVITVQGIASGVAQPVSGTVAATQSGTWTVQPGNTANTTAWKVDGSAVTQPVSGTVAVTGVATAANQSTGNTSLGTLAGAVAGSEMQVDIVTSALPALAATSTKQSDGTQKTQLVDGSGNVIASTSNNLNVQCANCSGSGASATDAATFTASTSTMAPAGAFYQTTATDNALTNGKQGMLQATAQRALFVNLRDAAGAEVSVGGGTQYNEDDAHASGNKLTMAGGVRRDTPASSTATDGDNATLNLNSSGRLYTSATIDAALPAGTNAIGKLSANSGVDIGDVDITSSALPTGAATAAKQPALGTAGSASTDVITIQGIASGTPLAVSDNSGSLTVDYATTGSGTATGALRVELPTNGTGAIATVGAVTAITNALPTGTNAIGTVTAVGAAATDAAVSGNPVYTAGRASAAAPTDVSADGDVVPAWRLRNGAAATVLTAAGALVGGDATNGLDVDVTRLNDGGNSITVDNGGTFAVQAGQAAHDAAIAGNPVRIGGRAQTANITAVASGDQVDAVYTIEGKQVFVPYAVRGDHWSYAAASGGIVNTTAATIKAAAGSGIRNCIASVDLVNGHATVSTEVVIRDGAAGTVLKRYWAQAAGGGLTKPYPVQVCSSTNTLLEVAAITTGSAIYVNAEGFVTAE